MKRPDYARAEQVFCHRVHTRLARHKGHVMF